MKKDGRNSIVHWGELTWEEVRERAVKDPVVIVPIGSTEQHGWHLPVHTDSKLVDQVVQRAVETAATEIPVLVCPILPYGCSDHHTAFPGTISWHEEVFVAAVVGLGLSLTKHGFWKILFVTGHGGNEAPLSLVVSEIRRRTKGDVLCASVAYWRLIPQEAIARVRRSMPGGAAHAGELETAGMLVVDERNVHRQRIEKAVPQLSDLYQTVDLFQSGPVTVGLHHADISESGAVGDPTVATKETGQAFLDLAARHLKEFLVTFNSWNRPADFLGKARQRRPGSSSVTDAE